MKKKYKPHKDLPELTIVQVKTEVALYPSKRSYLIEHDFILENNTTEAIEELWFTATPYTEVVDFKISKAQLSKHDTIHRVYWFKLDEPLLPKGQVKMEYDVTDNHQGFKTNSSFWELDVVANGTNIMNQLIFPTFGYSSSREITDNAEREKRGLAPKVEQQTDVLHTGDSDQDSVSYHKFKFETILSTAAGQTAIAPGKLIRQWKENNRNFFHYKADQPINNFYSYLSAEYELEQKMHDRISLEIYHAKDHGFNSKRILETMEVSLDYCQQAFSPYGFDHCV